MIWMLETAQPSVALAKLRDWKKRPTSPTVFQVRPPSCVILIVSEPEANTAVPARGDTRIVDASPGNDFSTSGGLALSAQDLPPFIETNSFDLPGLVTSKHSCQSSLPSLVATTVWVVPTGQCVATNLQFAPRSTVSSMSPPVLEMSRPASATDTASCGAKPAGSEGGADQVLPAST